LNAGPRADDAYFLISTPWRRSEMTPVADIALALKLRVDRPAQAA
jgi:hypothetical protein